MRCRRSRRRARRRAASYGPVVDRAEQLEGYTVNFTSFREDIDGTPLLKGLPDDRCQCPHWGYVITGRIDLPLRGPRGGLRGRRRVLHAARPRPGQARARHRVRDVQPRRGAAQDRGRHDEEHAGDAGRLKRLRRPRGRETPPRAGARAASRTGRRPRGSRRRSWRRCARRGWRRSSARSRAARRSPCSRARARAA